MPSDIITANTIPFNSSKGVDGAARGLHSGKAVGQITQDESTASQVQTLQPTQYRIETSSSISPRRQLEHPLPDGSPLTMAVDGHNPVAPQYLTMDHFSALLCLVKDAVGAERSSGTPTPMLHEDRGTMQAFLVHIGHIMQAKWRQKYYADSKRREVEYAVGDKVWLSSKHLPAINNCPKFEPGYCVPFTVTERMGKVAYRLALPPRVCCCSALCDSAGTCALRVLQFQVLLALLKRRVVGHSVWCCSSMSLRS